MLKRYKCKKELMLDYYDADGFYIENKQVVINVSDIYEYDEDYQEPLMIAAETAIHLDLVHDNICQWIEIYPEDLAEYFEEMTEGENG